MNKLIEKISLFVEKLFESYPSVFSYHNLRHTKDVVSIVQDIAENSDIDEKDKELLLIAAWFHDTGYQENISIHEEKSAEIAETYLKNINFAPDKISIVRNLILSTKMPQKPKTVLEEIICDADIAYIGSDNLINRIPELRKEWKQTINKNYTDSEWFKENIKFIESHTFYTDYARKKFGGKRIANLTILKQLLEKTDGNKNR